MQTIIIKLSPSKLSNPDLDLRYIVPDAIEKETNGAIQDNGYDYLSDGSIGNHSIGIWLSTEDAKGGYPLITELFRREKFLGNDLSESAEIYISENDTEEIENCSLVYPVQPE